MYRILVVEDEPAIAEVFWSILEDAGYLVDVVANGPAALERLATRKPDLIISDITMPMMSGVELCRAVQAVPEWRTIPFVATSAANEQISAPECNFAAYIDKPFLLPDLLNTVANLLDRPTP